MRSEAAALLKELELVADPRALVSQLKVGAQQVVEIARPFPSTRASSSWTSRPRPSRVRDETLFRQIKRLKQSGVGLIYITHKLDELPEIADDITVFRDGKFVAAKEFRDVTRTK